MKRKTSEIIAALQKCVDKHGDMPFELRDNENGCSFFDVSVFADTIDNGGCDEDETPTIGISFQSARFTNKNWRKQNEDKSTAYNSHPRNKIWH